MDDDEIKQNKSLKKLKPHQAEFSLRFSDNREINLDDHIHLVAQFLFCKIFESDAIDCKWISVNN